MAESRPAACDDDDDDEEYEVVIYNGPDAPYEIIKTPDHLQNKTVPPNVKLELMKARLAQTSAECGGLLTPHFFLLSPGMSSADASSQEISGTSNTDPRNASCMKSPFAFPQQPIVNSDVAKSNPDTIVQELERIEILDDEPSDENEVQWVEWPKKYIECEGFCLGVQPGNFFKNESRPCFYVKLPHLSNYEVVVTNNSQVPCDLDLHVNGKHVAALRLLAGTTRSIDGPQYSQHAFKLFRAKDVPPDKNAIKGSKMNGLVKAVFTPCKVDNSRLRSASEPIRADRRVTDFLDIFDDVKEEKKQRSVTIAACDEDKAERSLDISRVVEGVTLLQGKKKKKNYVLAPEMETDPSKRVVLQLRLIASLDEEEDATEDKVYDLSPPPLPTRR